MKTAAHGNPRAASTAPQLARDDLFDSLPQPAWIADPDGCFTHCNRRLREYTGASLEQLLGWGWQSVHDPECLPDVVEHWRAALEREEPFEMAFPLRRRDGAFRWFMTHAEPLRDSSGKVVRWVGISVDIDDQKRAESNLRRALRARETLVATVSHDLRNPLSAVVIAAKQIELLIDPAAAGVRGRKAVTAILGAADRMMRLVGDLLDLARLEADKPLLLEVAQHELVALLEEATLQQEPLAVSRRVALRLEALERPVYVLGDRHRIHQVLANLIGNALKFTPEGGAIDVAASRGAGEIVVSIRDTGVGIGEDQLPKIFEPYWQADTQQRNLGTGLGLSIAKAIVDAHRGRVWVESTVGRGSAFFFTLPLSPDDPAPEEESGT